MKKFILVLLLGVSSVLLSQNTSERTKHFNLGKDIAINGYDPVAYFTSNKALKGNDKFLTNYMGITYQFTSKLNKEYFIKNPTKYEPQYGGWCAYAIGEKSEKVKINPETFKIIDGKLYLFYNAYFNNTLKTWNKNEDKLITKANSNWTKILKSK
jgi:YHS domain-containing protein